MKPLACPWIINHRDSWQSEDQKASTVSVWPCFIKICQIQYATQLHCKPMLLSMLTTESSRQIATNIKDVKTTLLRAQKRSVSLKEACCQHDPHIWEPTQKYQCPSYICIICIHLEIITAQTVSTCCDVGFQSKIAAALQSRFCKVSRGGPSWEAW